MAAWLGAAGALGAVEAGEAATGGSVPSRTHFVVDPADLARLRGVRAAAAEMRQAIAEAEAELAVID